MVDRARVRLKKGTGHIKQTFSLSTEADDDLTWLADRLTYGNRSEMIRRLIASKVKQLVARGSRA